MAAPWTYGHLCPLSRTSAERAAPQSPPVPPTWAPRATSAVGLPFCPWQARIQGHCLLEALWGRCPQEAGGLGAPNRSGPRFWRYPGRRCRTAVGGSRWPRCRGAGPRAGGARAAAAWELGAVGGGHRACAARPEGGPARASPTGVSGFAPHAPWGHFRFPSALLRGLGHGGPGSQWSPRLQILRRTGEGSWLAEHFPWAMPLGITPILGSVHPAGAHGAPWGVSIKWPSCGHPVKHQLA